MSNLGEGIREKAAIETTAEIVANIMKNKRVSFEDAFASIYAPENNKETIKACVDKMTSGRIGLAKGKFKVPADFDNTDYNTSELFGL